MKKTLSFLLVLITLVCLFSCEPSEESAAVSKAGESTATCTELRDAAYTIEKAHTGEDIHSFYSSDSEDTKLDEFMTSGYYGTLTETPDLDSFTGYAIFITDEPTVSEFGIFKAPNDEKAQEAVTFCTRRIEALKKKFEGYKPEMVTAAGNAVCKTYGSYVYYIATVINNEAIETQIKLIIDSKSE
ncbi:MAG TPA: DUF4358 domain-containing protein [Bacillota bacterium]|nr:DUF4358 domain-containing protein [Bacillota bacterium]